MFKTIYFLLFISSLYSNSLHSYFLNYHHLFLNSNIKCMDFSYTANNIEGLSENGEGTLILGENKYKLILGGHTFFSQNGILKRYNKNTNQIFIEDSLAPVDSMFINFFDTEFLSSSIDKPIYLLELDNKQWLEMFIDFNNNSSIESISIFELPPNERIIEFININLYSCDNTSTNLFNFKFKNAFVLDLRD